MTVRIQTERLLIRSFREDDIPAYAEIVADPDVTRYLGDGRTYTPSEAAEYVRDLIALEADAGVSRYAVELAGELIGFCGFKPVDDFIDFGWRYARKHWGHGYATEAARAVLAYGTDVLRLESIRAGAYEANVGSVRVIEKLGFDFLGTQDTERGPIAWYARP